MFIGYSGSNSRVTHVGLTRTPLKCTWISKRVGRSVSVPWSVKSFAKCSSGPPMTDLVKSKSSRNSAWRKQSSLVYNEQSHTFPSPRNPLWVNHIMYKDEGKAVFRPSKLENDSDFVSCLFTFQTKRTPFHLEIYFAAMFNQNRFALFCVGLHLMWLQPNAYYDSVVGRQHQCTSAHVVNAVWLITHSPSIYHPSYPHRTVVSLVPVSSSVSFPLYYVFMLLIFFVVNTGFNVLNLKMFSRAKMTTDEQWKSNYIYLDLFSKQFWLYSPL